jgi:hypothetical protein
MISPIHVKPPTRHQLGSLCSLHRKAADGKATQEPIVLAFSGSPVLSQIVTTLFFGGSIPNSEFSLPRTKKGIDHNIGI